MFVSLICTCLVNIHRWSSSSIYSGIRGNVLQQQGRHRYKTWPVAKAMLAIGAEVLERLLPMVAYVVPEYEPILLALMIGCITLTVRPSPGMNWDKCDRAKSMEDAA
jgi:hypothetical protein